MGEAEWYKYQWMDVVKAFNVFSQRNAVERKLLKPWSVFSGDHIACSCFEKARKEIAKCELVIKIKQSFCYNSVY